MCTKTILLASHIPNIDKIWIGKDILDKIKISIPSANIIVGINPSPCMEEWIKIVKNYTDLIEITPNHLIIESDASSYQSALRKYKELNIKSDLIWFLHTQGTRSDRHSDRNEHLNCLLGAKDNICQILNNNIKIGSFGRILTPLPNIDLSINEPADKVMNDYYNFPYTNLRWFYLGAMFIMKGLVLNEFLYKCSDDFFNMPLSKFRPYDRWFIERDFIEIIQKMGYEYEMYSIDNNYNIPLPNGINLNGLYDYCLSQWKDKNNKF